MPSRTSNAASAGAATAAISSRAPGGGEPATVTFAVVTRRYDVARRRVASQPRREARRAWRRAWARGRRARTSTAAARSRRASEAARPNATTRCHRTQRHQMEWNRNTSRRASDAPRPNATACDAMRRQLTRQRAVARPNATQWSRDRMQRS